MQANVYISGSYNESLPPATGIHQHIHNHYELLYFIEGGVEYIIQGNVYNIKSRTLILIPPRCVHSAKLIHTDTYKRAVIWFSKNAVDSDTSSFLDKFPIITRIPSAHPVDTLFDIYVSKAKGFTDEDFRVFDKHFINLILFFAKELDANQDINTLHRNQKLYAILDYIHTHPQEKLTAKTIAEKFNVSMSWLTHSFAKELGVSATELIAKNKILYTQSLILSGMRPTYAAEQCGYDNYSTFFRQYIKIIGHSPNCDYVKISKK